MNNRLSPVVSPSDQESSLPASDLAQIVADQWPIAIVRYGRVPEIARYGLPDGVSVCRGDRVVIESPRGPLVADVLEQMRRDPNPNELGQQREQPETTGAILRHATTEDLATHRNNDEAAAASYLEWAERIHEWEIDLELVDVELTLDKRITLYVLNDRGAEPTKLALRAVTEHLGLVDVQPVTAEGLVPPETGGGCGSCGSH